MTDRELLELAAKAAALPGTWVDGFGYRVDCDEPYFWTPLTDDGDALRLAVTLGIGMIHHKGWGQVFHPALGDRRDFYYEGDPYAATRCAVVRAAAEIGRAMK